VFPTMHPDSGNAKALLFPRRFEQQAVDLFSTGIGRNVIRTLEVDRINVRSLYEVKEVNRVGTGALIGLRH